MVENGKKSNRMFHKTQSRSEKLMYREKIVYPQPYGANVIDQSCTQVACKLHFSFIMFKWLSQCKVFDLDMCDPTPS